MTEIRIDAGKAERIITQMLREEQGVHPADAVALAASICRRLATAMPTNPSLGCCRIIERASRCRRFRNRGWKKAQWEEWALERERTLGACLQSRSPSSDEL